MPLEWLIDLIKEWVQAQGYLTTSFVDRGDPAVADFAIGDFVKDSAWHELDLSAIVPAGAKAVSVSLRLIPVYFSLLARFRRHGNANTTNVSSVHTQVAGFSFSCDITIPVDSDRKIDYYFQAATWTLITFTVKGWWL